MKKGFTERMAANYCEWFRDYRKRYNGMKDLSTVGQIFYGTLFYTNVPIYLGVQKWRESKITYLDR